MNRRTFAVFCAMLALALPASQAHAQPNSPVQLIEAFHDRLLTVLVNAQTLGFAGRREQLVPVVDETFNSSAIARIVVGAAWKTLDDATRQRLATAVRDMSIATYASRFDNYGGQSFELYGERNGPRDTRLVDTAIVSPGKEPIGLTYVAKEMNDRWWIIDVIVDNGISELALKRAEYRSVLEAKGVDGLIRALESRAAGLEHG